jgi:charged multivesicular body protein 7
MFSPFPPSRANNPTHWDSKLQFWSDVITSHCRHAGRLIFTLQYLERAFRRKKSVPACLEVVLRELHLQKKILTKPEFLNSVNEAGWARWTVGLIVGTARMFIGSTVDIRGSDFVALDLTREKVHEIMTSIYERKIDELVMSEERFGVLCKEIDSRLSVEDVGMVVCELRREKRAIVGEAEGVRIIQLAGRDEGCLGQGFTVTDKAIFK